MSDLPHVNVGDLHAQAHNDERDAINGIADAQNTIISNDTAGWASDTDTILASGQIGYDTDKHSAKLGDDSSEWQDLRFIAHVTSQVADDCDLTGGISAVTYVQGLLDSANAASSVDGYLRRIVFMGTYLIDAPLKVYSNVELHLLPGAWLKKGWDTGQTLPTTMIQNHDLHTKISNFRITGPGRIGNDNPAANRGNIIAILGDDCFFGDFTVNGWGGGRAIAFVGNRNHVDSVRLVNSTGLAGDGGIRIFGGDDNLVFGCDVNSGDDALQFVPTNTASLNYPEWFNVSINRSKYVACSGSSVIGRFIAVTLQNLDTDTQMVAHIQDVSFIGCKGYSGGTHHSVMINNFSSTGDIDGVSLVDCFSGSNTVELANSEIFIARYPDVQAGCGRVRNILLSGQKIRAPKRTGLVTRGGIENLTLRDCSVEAPTSAVIAGCIFQNGSNTMIAPADPTGLTQPFDPAVDIGSGIIAPNFILPNGTSITAISADGLTVTLSQVATVAGGGSTTVVQPATVGGTFTAYLGGTKHCRVFGGTYYGGGVGHVVQVGSADIVGTAGTAPQTGFDFLMHGAVIDNVPDAHYAVNFNLVSGGALKDTTAVGAAGTTTAASVRVAALSSGCRISGNDFSGLPSPNINDLSSAGDTFQSNNRGIAASSVVAIGGSLLVRLTADTLGSAMNNNVIPITIPALALANIPANTEWGIESCIMSDGTITADLRWGWTITGAGSSDSSGKWSFNGGLGVASTTYTGTMTRQTLDITATGQVGMAGEGTANTVTHNVIGYFKAGTGGNVTLTPRYCQQNASADPVGLILRAGTWIKLTRLA